MTVMTIPSVESVGAAGQGPRLAVRMGSPLAGDETKAAPGVAVVTVMRTGRST